MEEHLVGYLLITNKKECYTYFLVVVVKQSAVVWLDLVLAAIVTKKIATVRQLLIGCQNNVITPPSGWGLVISVFTPPSERRLVIPIFFPFGGHLPQTSGFRSAKQIRLADVRSTEVLSSAG